MPRRICTLAIAAVLLIAAVSITAASGASSKLIVKAQTNTTLGKRIVVDLKGKSLYRLSGETSKTFKCTSTACLGAWPPLTVTSKTTKLHAGPGVHGTLTVVKRAGVKGYQVLLGGKPLYHFAGDTAMGDAKGNGITAFGGTWNVLSATGGAKTAPTTTTKSTPPPPPPAY
jgi:predicted lipoprotein with Yx(FWY)xxD motif